MLRKEGDYLKSRCKLKLKELRLPKLFLLSILECPQIVRKETYRIYLITHNSKSMKIWTALCKVVQHILPANMSKLANTPKTNCLHKIMQKITFSCAIIPGIDPEKTILLFKTASRWKWNQNKCQWSLPKHMIKCQQDFLILSKIIWNRFRRIKFKLMIKTFFRMFRPGSNLLL